MQAGRCYRRCGFVIGSDVNIVDGTIPEYAWYLWGTCTSLAAQTISIMIFAPVAVIPAAIMGAAGLLIGRVYVQANMSVKREMANAKAPVLASFGAAMAGLGRLSYYSFPYEWALTTVASIHPRVRRPRNVPSTVSRPH